MPELAGKALAKDGQFEKVGFYVGAAYDEAGKKGGVLVAITITGPDSPRKGKHTQVEGNWRSDDPEKIAGDAIAAYLKLRGALGLT